MSDNYIPTSSIPSQSSFSTPTTTTLTPNDPVPIPIEPVTAPVTEPVTKPIAHTTVSQPTQSLSNPTSVPPIYSSIPQVTSMFQVPSVTNTHSMVTRSKVGIFKPKALAA